jgi:zinc/manganese transport system substrate-binding protein
VVFGFVTSLLLSMPMGCDSKASRIDDDPERRIKIVASFSILAEWVDRVGGERVDVVTLVGPESDAHRYEPTPRDAVAISEADLVFEVGLGFENWMNQLCERAGVSDRRRIVARTIKPRAVGGPHGHVEFDPHVWQSPVLAIAMVRVIADELIATDPESRDVYSRRAAEYVRELEMLHEQIKAEVASLEPGQRKLVTTHDTFGYFADEYGFEVKSVLGSVSSEVADPAAGEIAAIVEHIRRENVRAIFAENILNPALTAQVAREAGVTLAPLLYTDALGPSNSPGSNYLGMMRFNVRTMVEALR